MAGTRTPTVFEKLAPMTIDGVGLSQTAVLHILDALDGHYDACVEGMNGAQSMEDQVAQAGFIAEVGHLIMKIKGEL